MSIGTYLQFEINKCVSIIFPDVLKQAYVTLIYKKSDPLEAENYRPISVTRTPAIFFERLLPQQMLEHVEKYRKSFENRVSVISLTEPVNSLLENATVLSMFLDLAKAFNSLS